MATSSNGSDLYFLDVSGAVAVALRWLQQRATREGRGRAYSQAFRRIVRRLRRDPMNLGEPLYDLPTLRLQVRTVVSLPLAIDFAVDAKRRIVYIKGGRLLTLSAD